MKAESTRWLSIVALSTAALISVSGCSRGDDANSAPSNSTAAQEGTSSGQAAPTPAATGTPASPTSGILMLGTTGNKETYGIIDPSSGRYSQLASFTIPSGSLAGPVPEIAASPDLTKRAFTKMVDKTQTAGWIDSGGNFTAVTHADAPGAFGGAGQSFTALGFDKSGNFYYRSQSAEGYAVFKTPAGSTSGAQGVTLSSPSQAQAGAWLNYDGTMQFGCTNMVPHWLGPDAVVSASGPNQIVKWAVTGRDNIGCLVTANDVALLPSTNTAKVHDAVGSPDGTKVAFLYDTADVSDRHPDLYSVPADGASQPAKVTMSNLNLQPYEVITLLKWI